MAKPQISAIVLSCVVAVAVLCAFPAHVSAARDLKKGFIVQGRIFCDTCKVGFETPASTYIAGNFTFLPSFFYSIFRTLVSLKRFPAGIRRNARCWVMIFGCASRSGGTRGVKSRFRRFLKSLFFRSGARL